MVNRTNYGSYEITPYGTQAVRLLDGYKFLSRHSEYFATHSLKELPQKFQNRLGELNDSEPVNRIMDTFGGIEKMIREAEEYYLYITQETLMTESGVQYTLNALDNGVKGKGIKPTGFTRPRIIEDTIPDEVWKDFRSHNQKGSLEHKYLESIDIALFMSEKDVFFDFPDNAGNYDYLGFTSTDAKALDWGKDVFEYYWERASLINSV